MHRTSVKLVLALVGVLVTATADAQSLKVTVESTKSKTAISNASILVQSSSGYMMGSGWQDFGGLYVTDAVVPPEGVKLKPARVVWRDIRRVDFTAWSVKEGDDIVTKAKLTLRDGSNRDVFAWQPSSSDFYCLGSAIKFEGKMLVQGKEQDVVIQPSNELKAFEFDAPD